MLTTVELNGVKSFYSETIDLNPRKERMNDNS